MHNTCHLSIEHFSRAWQDHLFGGLAVMVVCFNCSGALTILSFYRMLKKIICQHFPVRNFGYSLEEWIMSRH
jgi:hypothetical protein